MWVYTRQRNEQDKRMLINLQQYASITISQLGNRWFVDVSNGNDSTPLASVEAQEEADRLVQSIFDALHSGEQALDLNAVSEKSESKDDSPAEKTEHAPRPVSTTNAR